MGSYGLPGRTARHGGPQAGHASGGNGMLNGFGGRMFQMKLRSGILEPLWTTLALCTEVNHNMCNHLHAGLYSFEASATYSEPKHCKISAARPQIDMTNPCSWKAISRLSHAAPPSFPLAPSNCNETGRASEFLSVSPTWAPWKHLSKVVCDWVMPSKQAGICGSRSLDPFWT